MQVLGAFVALNIDCMTWKSTSSNGWEYLIMWEDLGLSSMYANCVLFICYYFNYLLIMVEWFSIDLALW